jgi:hypothetical protein
MSAGNFVADLRPALLYAAAGYNDARDRLPFRDAYETLPEWGQRAYEAGRYLAVYLRACGVGAPPWRWSMSREPPPAAVAKARSAGFTPWHWPIIRSR